MSFLELLVFGGMIATAGFFFVYFAALQQGLRDDRTAQRQPTHDAVGGSIIFGARTAFAVGLAALFLLTLSEMLP